jgi:hypothetical protein
MIFYMYERTYGDGECDSVYDFISAVKPHSLLPSQVICCIISMRRLSAAHVTEYGGNGRHLAPWMTGITACPEISPDHVPNAQVRDIDVRTLADELLHKSSGNVTQRAAWWGVHSPHVVRICSAIRSGTARVTAANASITSLPCCVT